MIKDGLEGATKNRFCVLVSSSDHGRDVFEIVFRNAESIWRDCDWLRYVGFTSKHPDIYSFKTLAAREPSNWRGELIDQLESLPHEIEYVFLVLEDTLFKSPVNGSELNAIANLIVQEDLSYVRLVPVKRNLPGLIVEYFRKRFSGRPLRRLSLSEPYYSSLTTAIWKRNDLLWLLQQRGSIWDLEHIVTHKPHYAVWKQVFRLDNLVIKGKWDPRTPQKLARQGIPFYGSKREFRPFGARLRDFWGVLVFQTVGFLSFRIRRRLNMVSNRAPVRDTYTSRLTDEYREIQ
jgi:hypothetical protein